MLTEQVFLSYHRTKRQLPTPLKQKQWQNGVEKKHFRKSCILLASSLLHTKTLNIRTDNHEGDTSREVRKWDLEWFCLNCLFNAYLTQTKRKISGYPDTISQVIWIFLQRNMRNMYTLNTGQCIFSSFLRNFKGICNIKCLLSGIKYIICY